MRKTYRYKNLSFPVSDETEIWFEVEFISDGNFGQTIINVPGPNDKIISNSGKASIGRGVDLRDDTTICFTDVENPIPEEDTIKIKYWINGELIVEHQNLKTEEERPFIVLSIKFPAL